MLMRRLGAGDFTVHGMRSAARPWMADQGIAFALAERLLADLNRSWPRCHRRFFYCLTGLPTCFP